MNLLKSTGFLLKSLYLRPFRSLNVRGDFRIFSNLLVSFHAFLGNFGKNIGKIGAFTNEIVTQKEHTVKSTLAKRKASGQNRRLILKVSYYSTKPYLTLMRSNFSNMGSAAMRMNITVAAAWIRSIGRPDT